MAYAAVAHRISGTSHESGYCCPGGWPPVASCMARTHLRPCTVAERFSALHMQACDPVATAGAQVGDSRGESLLGHVVLHAHALPGKQVTQHHTLRLAHSRARPAMLTPSPDTKPRCALVGSMLTVKRVRAYVPTNCSPTVLPGGDAPVQEPGALPGRRAAGRGRGAEARPAACATPREAKPRVLLG